jgi:inosose dehydratase
MKAEQKWHFDRAAVSLGIVPTIWTNDDMPLLGDNIPFEQCVSEIALAGYQGCSLGHKFPSDIGSLRTALEMRHLRVCSAWVGMYFTANAMRQATLDEFDRQARLLKDLGATDVAVAELGRAVHQQPVAVLPNKPMLDDNQWRALIEGLKEIGRRAESLGLRIDYHPHVGTAIQNRGEIDRLMNSVDERYISLLLDTAHLYYADVDPFAMARDYADRIHHVHLKNIRQTVLDESRRCGYSFLDSIRAGVFTVPGDPAGALDLEAILGVLAQRRFRGWLVVEAEQDPARAHPLTYALMAARYVKGGTGL